MGIRSLKVIEFAAVDGDAEIRGTVCAEAGEVVSVDYFRCALELANQFLVARDIDALKLDAGELSGQELCLRSHGGADSEEEGDVFTLDKFYRASRGQGPQPEMAKNLLGFTTRFIFPVLERCGQCRRF